MRRVATFTLVALLAVVTIGGLAFALAQYPGSAPSEAPSAALASDGSGDAPKGSASSAEALSEGSPRAVLDEEELLAQEALADLADTYRHLDDVRVRIGDTPKGEEAVAYYTSGEIVIDRDHTVGVQKILAHEVWHVIDWRDNGRLDWGEDLPPSNSADYIKTL